VSVPDVSAAAGGGVFFAAGFFGPVPSSFSTRPSSCASRCSRASSPRTRFEYQNIMFLAAGQVVPAVSGKSWDDVVRDCPAPPARPEARPANVSALVD